MNTHNQAFSRFCSQLQPGFCGSKTVQQQILNVKTFFVIMKQSVNVMQCEFTTENKTNCLGFLCWNLWKCITCFALWNQKYRALLEPRLCFKILQRIFVLVTHFISFLLIKSASVECVERKWKMKERETLREMEKWRDRDGNGQRHKNEWMPHMELIRVDCVTHQSRYQSSGNASLLFVTHSCWIVFVWLTLAMNVCKHMRWIAFDVERWTISFLRDLQVTYYSIQLCCNSVWSREAKTATSGDFLPRFVKVETNSSQYFMQFVVSFCAAKLVATPFSFEIDRFDALSRTFFSAWL